MATEELEDVSEGGRVERKKEKTRERKRFHVHVCLQGCGCVADG